MEDTATTAAPPAVEMVRVDHIDPSPLNRPCGDDDQDIAELAVSIDEVGLRSPISIRPVGDGRFEIVCGERRWRAFRRLGCEVIPCIVDEMDEAQAHAVRLIENAQRKDLSFIEQGVGVGELLKRLKNNCKEVADHLGKNEGWVRVRAKLPNLSDAWRAELAAPETGYAGIRDSIIKLAVIASLPQSTQDDVLAQGYLRYHHGTVSEMHKALERLFMNLDTKPWVWTWEKEHISSRKRCDSCKKRSDREYTLFSDLDDGADGEKEEKKLCLDADCWRNRMIEWCKYLFREKLHAVALWDGYPSAADERFCQEQYGQTPLRSFAWEERGPDDKAGDEFSIATKGVFVGGARAGVCIDIWLRNETGDDEFDAEQQAKADARQREEDAQQKRYDLILQRLEAAIPKEISAIREKTAQTDDEFAFMLLNWASWFGVGSAACEDPEFDVTDTAPGSCPGAQHVWHDVREDVIDRFIGRFTGGKVAEGEWFIMTTLCEILSIDCDSLGKTDGEENANAE